MSARNLIVRLWKEEEGASLLEYGLLIGFMAVIAVAALTVFGDGLVSLFQKADQSVQGAGDQMPTADFTP